MAYSSCEAVTLRNLPDFEMPASAAWSRTSDANCSEPDIQDSMKRLRILRRWFKRRFGYARLVCLALLIGLAALRIADPAPVEELRVRTFDTFQRIDPRVKTARPVTIVDIDEKSLRETRPVALAADADRGSRRQSDQARRRRDRLRRHLLGARPAQSRRRRRYAFAISMRRPEPSCGRCRATIRFSRMRCGTRAWCWANPDFRT